MGHNMMLRHGPFLKRESITYDKPQFMHDACSLTTQLLGAEKLIEGCKDRSESEMKKEYYTQLTFNLVVSGIAIAGAYKLGKGFLTSSWRAAAPYAIPLAKAAFQKSLPLWEAIYGMEQAAVTYFTSPISKIGWAGRVGWAGVAFYGGWKVGRLIDQIPKLWGGREISSHLADGMERVLGPAPDWLIDSYDWSAHKVTQSKRAVKKVHSVAVDATSSGIEYVFGPAPRWLTDIF